MPSEVLFKLSEREAFFLNVYLKSHMQRLQRKISFEADLRDLSAKDDLRELLTLQDRLEKAIRGIDVSLPSERN